jgi:iron complex transport system permease protein
VSPDILGVSSGASLGAALAILNGASNWLIQLSAFTGGVLAVAFSYLISRKSAHSQILSLVLTGSMVMALCNAGVTMIKYISDPNDVLQQITFWLMGSLTKTDMASFRWSAVPMSLGLAMILLLRWRLNLLTLEEEEARTLGINVRRYRLLFLFASPLLSAAAVCLGGLIGWVGLMIPHMARALVGVDYSRLIPASAMLGAAYLVLMDDIARSLLSLELPLGVVTSIMGAPFFVYLIIKRKERTDMLLEGTRSRRIRRRRLVKGVSCRADAGDVLCLVGPNGAARPHFSACCGILPISRNAVRWTGGHPLLPPRNGTHA